MQYAMFVVVNLLIGLLFVVFAIVCLRVASAMAHRRGAKGLRWRAVPAIVGLFLMEFGVVRAIGDYRPFDPAKTALQMTCTAKGPLGTGDQEQIPFRYDPSRRCQNRTFYAAVDGGLRRIVLRSVRRSDAVVYQTRQLNYRPDFAQPTTAGVFTIVQSGDPALFEKLTSVVQGSPILCPAPGDSEAIDAASHRQAELDRLFGHRTGETVISWRCRADSKPTE